MILLYHKVALEAKTNFWVTVDTFYRQMTALKAYDVVPLSQYDPSNPRHVVITFDGVYENIFHYAFPILQKFNYPFELFVISQCIGQSNEFDKAEPSANFATLQQLKQMAQANGRVQWRTKSHMKLHECPKDQIEEELTVPNTLSRMFRDEDFTWFAYPHGDVNEYMASCVRKKFSGAVSCVQGNSTDRYLLNRTTVTETTNLFTSKVSVIIPNYNYGHFLLDAVESVQKQTIPPDEILIIDDASTDSSHEILNLLGDVAKIVINEKNLGTVENFNKAVKLTSGDYIAFLGADNRMRCDYIEKCRSVLDANPDACVVYTNMLVFGDRANIMAQKVPMREIYKNHSTRNGVYIWEFPSPEFGLKNFKKCNFIHGSSMYRRKDFEKAGGYINSSTPEDHNLFQRMITNERKPYHVPHALIEYRQHSTLQRNNIVSAYLEVEHLKKYLHKAIQQNEYLLCKINQLVDINTKLTSTLGLKEKMLNNTISLLTKIGTERETLPPKN